MLLGNKGITENNNTFADIKKNSEALGDQTTLSKEEKVSNQINYMYINMKDHLSVVDKKDDTDTDVSAWEVAGYTKNGSTYTYAPIKGSDGKNLDTFDYNYSLTPLTKYVDYDKIFSKNLSINKVEAIVCGLKFKPSLSVRASSGNMSKSPQNSVSFK